MTHLDLTGEVPAAFDAGRTADGLTVSIARKTACLPVLADAIPPSMRAEQRWLLWNREVRGGRGTKVPYRAAEPSRRASSTDARTWSSFDRAIAAYEDGKADGIGFALGDGWFGTDHDHCVDGSGINEVVRATLEALRTYAELSPSGTGVHTVGRGVLPPGARRLGTLEVYDTGRYFTVTGHRLPGAPDEVADCTSALASWHARVFGTSGAAGAKRRRDDARGGAVSPLDDDVLLDRARRAINGAKFSALWAGDVSAYSSASEADLALCSMLAFWTGRDRARIDRLFRQSGLMRSKWDERRGAASYGERTIERAVQNCTEVFGTGASAARGETVSDVQIDDFCAYMPQHEYLYIPTRELWPASSVNGRLPPVEVPGRDGKTTHLKPAIWLDQHRPIEQMTWMPGMPTLIRDRIVSDGGWIGRRGCTVFNVYRPPNAGDDGNPNAATPWLDHLYRLYPDDAPHMLAWLAHRVQRPGEKINHALVLGGMQGVGKDTILEPVKHAVGAWNVSEIGPSHLLGRFNEYVKSVILRISEARDLGDIDRYSLYERCKTIIAAPPDVLRVDQKHVREYPVFNVTGVIFTTNHKLGGIYLPVDDRRHYVAWTEATKDDFASDYWSNLYRWYADGGNDDVAAYLRNYDLSNFDPKAPPPKTAAFWALVDAERTPEDAEVADALDRLGDPEVVTMDDLVGREMGSEFGQWLRDRKNARQVPHRMEAAGYVPVRNDGAKDGLWKIDGRRQVIYARRELSPRDRIAAARERAGR